MATKRAASKGKPSQQKVETIVSIPTGVVLAPQAEAPRQPMSRDQSLQRSSVQELSWLDIDQAVQRLARSISSGFAAEAVVGVAHGGVFVGGALATALGCSFYPVRLSRRSRDRGTRIRLSEEMPRELKGRRVLVVDDVASSGDSLELACALAREAGASEVSTAVLVARPGGYSAGFHALLCEGLVVFPWDYEPVTEDERFDVDPDKAGA